MKRIVIIFMGLLSIKCSVKESRLNLNNSDNLKKKIIGEWYYVDSTKMEDIETNTYYYEIIVDAVTISHGSPIPVNFYSPDFAYELFNDTLFYKNPCIPILKFEEVCGDQLKARMLVEPYVSEIRHYYKIDSNRTISALDSVYKGQTYSFSRRFYEFLIENDELTLEQFLNPVYEDIIYFDSLNVLAP